MPVEVVLWRLGGTKPEKVALSTLNSEFIIEDSLEKDLSILRNLRIG